MYEYDTVSCEIESPNNSTSFSARVLSDHSAIAPERATVCLPDDIRSFDSENACVGPIVWA